MILSIPIEKIVPAYITFLDAKSNIVIDGKFSKILYVDENTVMNSLFIQYETNSPSMLYDIEKHILDSYMTFFHCNKNCIYMLKQNISMGTKKSPPLSAFRSSSSVGFSPSFGIPSTFASTSTPTLTPNNSKSCIKISGVWENDYNIGITYKLVILNDASILSMNGNG